jgi:WD40 repeat protein
MKENTGWCAVFLFALWAALTAAARGGAAKTAKATALHYLQGLNGVVALTPTIFSADGQRLACGFSEWPAPTAVGNPYPRLKVWEAATGKELLSLPVSNEVLCVAFSPNSKLLASGDRAGKVIVWDAVTGKQLSGQDHGAPVSDLVFSPDGRRLVSNTKPEGARRGSLRFWRVGD